MGQRLPDLLGDEGHEGVQQFQNTQQHIAQHVFGCQLRPGVFAVEAGLGQLDIPVTIGVPNEIINLGGRHAQLKGIHILRNFADQRVQLAENPFVFQLQLFRQLHFVNG